MKLTINLTVPSILITLGVLLQRATSLSSSPLSSQTLNSFSSQNFDMHITSLHRYAVKGLSGDSMQSVILNENDGTFEDDRRYALLFDNSEGARKFDENDPKWLHKDNFLCAFTAPELLATLRTEYKVESDSGKRLLSVWNRNDSEPSNSDGLLLLADLASQVGRDETSEFCSELCGKKVVCICASDNAKSSTSQNEEVDDDVKSNAAQLGGTHTHQFGNTSSGVKNNNEDTRTIHIVNSNTVKQFSDAIQHELTQQYKVKNSDETDETDPIQLNPTRFRPNIVVDCLDPWLEFDLIGKTIEVIPKQDSKDTIEHDLKSVPLRFRITSRTVRCAGIGVDPLQPELGALDIPKLLTKHFPQHGPYLGVYAVVEKDDDYNGGEIRVGDSFRVLEE